MITKIEIVRNGTVYMAKIYITGMLKHQMIIRTTKGFYYNPHYFGNLEENVTVYHDKVNLVAHKDLNPVRIGTGAMKYLI